MRITELRTNLEKAEEIARNLVLIEPELEKSKDEEEKSMLRQSHASLAEQLRIINNSIPDLMTDKETVVIEEINISKKDKESYMKELQIEKGAFKKLGKKMVPPKEKKEEYHKAGFFLRTSGKLFSGRSLKLSQKSFFIQINKNLRRANMPYLLSAYISLTLFITSLSFVVSIILMMMLLILGINAPISISLLIFIPVLTFLFMLYYPSIESKSNSDRIDEEMPFAVINMSAIAGSGVEPTRVFRILAETPEYPAIGKEMKKLVNLINFYGYDLTTALSATAKSTSSQRFSELLNGMAMIISTGGNMQDYLNKVASDTLLDYRLRRKRYVTIAETYADIYTGLLIAAPLMFMLLLTMINIIGGSLGGFDAVTLSLLGLGAIALINLAFLVFLEVSAPKA